MNGKLGSNLTIILRFALAWLGSSLCLTGLWALLDPYGWQAAYLPQGEGALRFLPVSDDYAYLESQDGRFYAFGLAPDLSPVWVEVEALMVGEMRREGRSDCARVEGPWSPAVGSPSPAVEGVECGYWTADGVFYKRSFAILESGEVWRWHSP